MSGTIRVGRLRGDGADIDTNWEHLRAHDTAKGLPNTAPKLLCSGPAHQIIAKAIEVLLRLEADQIVSAEGSGEISMIGQHTKQLGSGERRVQKEADRLCPTQLA
jgi:hypothetical protein